MPETACNQCGKSFKSTSSKKTAYCSDACADCAKAARDLRNSVKSYRDNAEKRGISWELTEEQCAELFAHPCYLCGEPGPGGIDRVNNKKGYAWDNVCPCCGACNLLKGPTHLVSFLSHVKRIYERAENQGLYDREEFDP